ncbi:Uncharacterised protein [Yersinia frederiksenii]|nr:Uncharacterised protein [Yersinia frederiksenii]
MLKNTQLCLWIVVLPWLVPFAEENILLPPLIPLSIAAQHPSFHNVQQLPIKVTARDHLLLDKLAEELPNVSSTSEPVFSHAMQLIDNAKELDQKRWAQQFPEISDARVGRIVDLYLQLYDVEGIEYADGVDNLLHLRPGLTAAQGYEKARIASLERDILFKLSQQGLTLSQAEKLTPLAALGLAWRLQQEHQPTLAEVSTAIYQPENKAIKIQATILFNLSHYGNHYGEITAVATTDLNDWGVDQLAGPEQPVSRAARALRVIHQGTHATPAKVTSDDAYLANGFAPKNAQGRYLQSQSSELEEMILVGCVQIGFDVCRQQDFTQFLDLQHAVGSLEFSLKNTLKLHYQLQGQALDQLENKNAEQLYNLLLQEEGQMQQVGGIGYSLTVIFLSHFSQSNEVEPLTLEQTASALKRIAESMDVSHLPELAQITFDRIKQSADYIIDNTAIDVERDRFELDLKALTEYFEPDHPLYPLMHDRPYKTEQERIARQLDYLDMRLAYRHLPAAFDEDQAIRAILTEKGVKKIDDSRRYIYRQDPQSGFPQKEYDSPVNEFKRRRDASSHFVANMSMPGNNGRPINVFDTLEAKKAEYYDQINSHPAIRAQAIRALIAEGRRPKGGALQDKISNLAKNYRPESENSRFWGNAWTVLENHWTCKLPVPNPMCTIARVEGPRYRNEKENMAAGMTAMVMEAGLLRGMERGVVTLENAPPGIDPVLSPTLSAEIDISAEEIEPGHRTIQSPHGKPIEVQLIELKDPASLSGKHAAWIRQGAGGVYWEVDVATGQDLGMVLKDGPQFVKPGKLLGGGPNRFTETQLLTNADFDWLEESALRHACAGESPCALTSGGIFTYLNTGEMSLAEKFFEPLRENVAASINSGKSLHQLLEQLQKEGIETETSIFSDDVSNSHDSFQQAIQSFPDSINIYPYDFNAVRLEIGRLQLGESIMFFPERSHVITIVQTANKEGLYVFDTNLINLERLDLMSPSSRRIYEKNLPELITRRGKKYLSGQEAADLLEMYFRPSSRYDNSAAAIIHYKGRVSSD